MKYKKTGFNWQTGGFVSLNVNKRKIVGYILMQHIVDGRPKYFVNNNEEETVLRPVARTLVNLPVC